MSDLPVFTRVCDERIAELEARVQELEKLLLFIVGGEGAQDYTTVPGQYLIEATGVLNRTPAQSLKRHDVTRADIPDSLIAEIQAEALENECEELMRITDAMTEEDCEDFLYLRGMVFRLLSKSAELREKVK